MPKVTFKKDNIVVDVPEGTPLIEVCKENNVSEPFFSCEDGSCGTCLVGFDKPENLSAPEEKEAERLKICCAKPNERLSCKAKVMGDIEIEPMYG